MANSGNADVIKEFLVSIGFQMDSDGLGKMETAIGKVAGLAFSFAAALAGAATALTAFVEKVSAGAEDLYWASVRTRDSVSNIRDFQLQISKFGGSAEGALNALESMATFLRTNPAGEGYLHMLGVQTRDLNGQLKSSREMLEAFANAPMPYWLKVRIGRDRFGIDEKTLLAIQQGALRTKTVVSDLYKQLGMSAKEANDKEHAFNNQIADMEAQFGVLSTVLATAFLPAATKVVAWIQDAIIWFVKLNHSTNGAAAVFVGKLAGALGIFLATATLLSPAIYTVSKAFGLLRIATLPIGGAFEVLSASGRVLAALMTGQLARAVTLLWAAMAANPITWIVAGLAAIGLGAYEAVKHWDEIKERWGSLVAWFRDKYNQVATYLHLPNWSGETGSERATGERTSPLAKTMPLPGQKPNLADQVDATVSGWYKTLTAPPELPTSPARPEAPEPGTVPPAAAPFLPGGQNMENLPAFERLKYQQAPQPPATVQQPSESQPYPQVTATPLAKMTQQAMTFFRAAGLGAEATAGIVANLIRESRLNPQAVGDKGTSFGIAQWHDPTRQAAFASMFGHDLLHGSLEEQLKFVLYEITNGAMKAVGTALRGVVSAPDAAAVFSRRFEIPREADREADLRGKIATDLLRATPITAGPTANRNVTVSQKTDIRVVSPDPESAARATVREQSRVNGDMVRNFAGAVN